MDEKRKRGRPTSDPAQAVHMRLPASLLAAVDAAAESLGINRTQVVIKALRAYLDAQRER